MTDLLNPKAVIGDNQSAKHGEQVAAALGRDYEALVDSVSKALDEARELPKQIADEEHLAATSVVIKRLRDIRGRVEAFHVAEKEPHLRAGQAVDGFFFGLWDKLARRSKAANKGAVDVLLDRVTDYQNRKLAEEQERRRREHEEAERVAAAAREKAAAEARAAEEARLAAERARKPETIEAKGAVAEAQQDRASAAAVEAVVAGEKAQDARVSTLARPADIVRSRTPEALTTMKQEPYAEVIDRDKLDKEKLWPYVDMASIERALRAWAKNTGHMQQMPGASVGKRNKGDVR